MKFTVTQFDFNLKKYYTTISVAISRRSLENMDEISSFPPSAAPGAKVLLLGSMPGEESLRRGEYYAHPRNAFWKIMGILFDFDPALPYPERLAVLRGRGIALWDTLRSCRRTGSLDSGIREPVPNDIPGLLRRYPSIGHIFCNGTASYEFLRRCLPEVFHGPRSVTRLPSTSPAAALYSFERKLEAYRVIAETLASLSGGGMSGAAEKASRR